MHFSSFSLLFLYVYIFFTILSMFVLLFEQRKTYFRVQQAKKKKLKPGAQPRTKTLQMSIFFKNPAIFQQFSKNCAELNRDGKLPLQAEGTFAEFPISDLKRIRLYLTLTWTPFLTSFLFAANKTQETE